MRKSRWIWVAAALLGMGGFAVWTLLAPRSHLSASDSIPLLEGLRPITEIQRYYDAKAVGSTDPDWITKTQTFELPDSFENLVKKMAKAVPKAKVFVVDSNEKFASYDVPKDPRTGVTGDIEIYIGERGTAMTVTSIWDANGFERFQHWFKALFGSQPDPRTPGDASGRPAQTGR